jgi:hypothetical protein
MLSTEYHKQGGGGSGWGLRRPTSEWHRQLVKKTMKLFDAINYRNPAALNLQIFRQYSANRGGSGERHAVKSRVAPSADVPAVPGMNFSGVSAFHQIRKFVSELIR